MKNVKIDAVISLSLTPPLNIIVGASATAEVAHSMLATIIINIMC